MLRGKKIRLLPTPEQEILFWKSAGTSRWAYNYFLARNEEQYKTYLANGKKGKKSISEGVIRKEINNQLKPMAERSRQQCHETGSQGSRPCHEEIPQRCCWQTEIQDKAQNHAAFLCEL